MQKLLYIFLFSAILLTACRPKPLKVKVDPAESKLVVFSQSILDNVMIVTLTKSFSNLEGAPNPSIDSLLVSGATVKVKLNEKEFNFFEAAPGIYASLELIKDTIGTYELTAWKDNDTVYSSAKFLSRATFKTVVPFLEKNTADTSIYLDLSFTDFPNEENYYAINVYRKGENNSGIDGLNFFQNGQNVLAKTELISDKSFNGTYTKRLKVDNLFAKDSIVVSLNNIPKKYFEYLGFRTGAGNIFNQLQLEPLNYPTNIINGYGFFTITQPDLHYFDLSLY